jgi:hypothetical protein
LFEQHQLASLQLARGAEPAKIPLMLGHMGENAQRLAEQIPQSPIAESASTSSRDICDR